MSKASGVGLAVGLIVGVIFALAVPGAGLVADIMVASLAFSLGSVAGTFLFPPETMAQQMSAQKEVSIASAADGFPLNVVFGTCKVIGNFMDYQNNYFTSEAITESGGGGGSGGGGDEVTTGFKYYFTFEYGLCCGPIDGVGQIRSTPGSTNLRGVDPAEIVYFGDQPYLDLTLTGHTEGGPIRIYQGTFDQTRISTRDPYFYKGMNYRNMCWALFMHYWIGNVPNAKTYEFILTRWPRCYDENGVIIPEIITQGSNDPTNPSYIEANPAAILYEGFTNMLWGRGLSATYLNRQSFIEGSVYYANQNIGMSLKLTQQMGIDQLIESIRQHCNCITIWDGREIKLKVLLDTTNDYSCIPTITANDISKPEWTRPSWNSTTNELRAEFVNANKRYKSDILHVQNDAGIAITGSINSKRIVLNGFSNPENVQRQLNRILKEISYPAGTLTFYSTRFFSMLQPGDLFRYIWKEWSTGTVTSYLRIASIIDNQQTEGLKFIAIEDPYLTAVEGVQTGQEVTPPINPFDKLYIIPESERDLFNAGNTSSELLTPIMIMEMPCVLGAGLVNYLAVFAQKKSGFYKALQLSATLDSESEFGTIGAKPSWAITGTLTTELSDSVPIIDRTNEAFRIELTVDDDLASLLTMVSTVNIDADNMQQLVANGGPIMIIGNEMLYVGYADDLGTGEVVIRNILRGVYGTPIETHAIGSTFFLISSLDSLKYFYTVDVVPGFPNPFLGTLQFEAGQEYKFQASPILTTGLNSAVTAQFYTPYEAPDVKQVLGLGKRPFGPIFHSLSGSTIKTIKVRPRFVDRGAGMGNFKASLYEVITDTWFYANYAITCQAFDSGNVEINDEAVVSGTYKSIDSFNDPTEGLYTFTYTPPVGTVTLRVRTKFNGLSSHEFCEVTI